MTTQNTLNQSFQAYQSLVSDFVNSHSLRGDLLTNLGQNFASDAGISLLKSLADRELSVPIEIVPSSQIDRANGAYSASNNTIYLATELINSGDVDAVTKTLLEETGHYLDSQLNHTDAPGDEGAIFASLVLGENLDSDRLKLLQAEDDTTIVELDGAKRTIEQQGIIYVNANASGDNDGSSWQNAYSDLQDALTSATAGDQIWVADGTYRPTTDTERTASFVIANEVKVYGGFAGGETELSQRDREENITILSGEIGIANDTTDNSYHVVNISDSTSDNVLDGFTITGGNANDFGEENNYGGGIYAVNSNAVLTNLTITKNNAIFGAGMYSNNSQHQLSKIQFLDNEVSNFGDGGGLYATGSTDTLSNVTFSRNFAANKGGGIFSTRSNLDLNKIEFLANRASSSGGGIYNNLSSNLTLSDSVFLNNNALNNGGGIFNATNNPELEVEISDTIFKGNVADVGGGIYNQQTDTTANTVINSLFENNYSRVGAGIYNKNSSPSIINSTFVDNLSQYGSGIGSDGSSEDQPQIINSIFWDNLSVFDRSPIFDYQSVTDVSFSLVENSTDTDTENNNLNVDPLFVDAKNFDYRLSSDSPALNAGSNDAVIGNDTDLSDNPRIADETVDLGAYEGAEVDPVPTEPQLTDNPTVIYVNLNATGANDGSSWSNAYANLHDALRNAPLGSQIWVADGTYIPSSLGNREASFQLKNGVSLYGGFAGGETSFSQRNITANQTILSGELGETSELIDNSYHVVNASNVTNSAILDGFTISDGNANSTNGGGGIYSNASQATFRNLRIENNNALNGGGMFVGTSSSHILTNVTFANNNSVQDGGAVYSKGNNYFLGNEFANNTSGGEGGAIYNEITSVYIEGSTFDSNTATNAGGAIYFTDSFVNKRERIVNSLFNGNSSPLGGAIYNDNSNSEGINLTFVGNEAENGAAVYSEGLQDDLTPKYYNSIFWDNDATDDPAQIFNNGENTFVRNSIIQGGYEGEENLDNENLDNVPQFVDREAENFRLASSSPAIDAGFNDVVLEEKDLVNRERIINETVDIGAYEFSELIGITVNDVAITEGNEDSTTLDFILSLDSAASEAVTVEYAISENTATVEDDYTDASGTITFAPGETEQTISVAILGDTTVEENETFSVILSNPSNNAELLDDMGIATIENDDEPEPETTELFRFRNTSFPSGTYLFVGAEERDSILDNPDFNQTFELEGDGNAAFVASREAGDDYIPFYRLASLDTLGTYLFVSTAEYDEIFAEDSDQQDKWQPEGLEDGEDVPDFYLLDGGADLGVEFNRFQNQENGTFLYAGPDETAAIENDPNLSSLFINQGVAFESLA
jgi:predicted outer membrane repeat protein